ncbi:S8 family peptidase [Tenuibacillus multivorans]|uniref:Serine protease AprX n=1 Tax=Tenuibacillus multivorans TaxID=237069 RepID=A0A1H0DUE9_9BACI|nr:S8 family peptidase [Tenuibacillus multivorans]GEL76777.1 serine protease AprX [Tenuibacillus multivorans]SDN73708.1 serine protease AprX [Tenuibacillus multivorans]
MFGYSMVQMVRNHGSKLDRKLRDQLLTLYRPFKFTPCFLHKSFESYLKKKKKFNVIVQFNDNESCHLEHEMNTLNQVINRHRRCKPGKDLSTVRCSTATVTPEALEEVFSECNHIKKVYYDREVQALLDVATPTVQADEVVRNGSESTGEGVNVAVIDTGVHPHEDLQGRIVEFVDLVNQDTEPYDDNGHGTHCAGDVAGDGAMSMGQYQAPAPKANIIGVKVLDKMGSGSLSTVMEGVQWCIENQETIGIDVISMSLGSPANSSYQDEDDDPMVDIVETAWEAGMVVCVAAGNEGPEPNTIASPGISNKVITVGAMDDRDTVERSDDIIANFSSRGPTIYGVTKPDVVAPGVDIVSLRSPGSYIDKLQKDARVGEYYVMLSGTSMATPICAGVVALLLEHDPSLTPDDVKDLLINNAQGLGDPYIYGAGYIQAEEAIPEE